MREYGGEIKPRKEKKRKYARRERRFGDALQTRGDVRVLRDFPEKFETLGVCGWVGDGCFIIIIITLY